MEQAPKAKARKREEAGGNAALHRQAKALKDRAGVPAGAGEQVEALAGALEEMPQKAAAARDKWPIFKVNQRR